MGKDSKASIALVLGSLALILSIYSTISLVQYGLNTQIGNDEVKPADEEFDKEVKRVIDEFIKEQQEAAQKAATLPADPVALDEGTGLIKGDEDAQVVITEFSDYQCPYCQRFFTEAYQEIQEKYVDTGKVKYVFRDFPLSIHPQAKPAANAARCVNEEGGLEAYWKYHDILFNNQTALMPENLKEYAKQVDVDAEVVAKCIDEERFMKEVEADLEAGAKAGVTGTPAIFVNGRLMRPAGAQPFALFESFIEEELAKNK